jgi:hypothetical protein
VAECAGCGGKVEESFRFCPWCAAPQRLKLVEFFRGYAVTERDRGKALRVSRYLGPEPEERHVRFSVWSRAGIAEAAVSLDEREVGRLRRFLGVPAGATRRRVFRRAAARPGA